MHRRAFLLGSAAAAALLVTGCKHTAVDVTKATASTSLSESESDSPPP